MPLKGAKDLVIAVVILTGQSDPCLKLTKHLIQISTESLFCEFDFPNI